MTSASYPSSNRDILKRRNMSVCAWLCGMSGFPRFSVGSPRGERTTGDELRPNRVLKWGGHEARQQRTGPRRNCKSIRSLDGDIVNPEEEWTFSHTYALQGQREATERWVVCPEVYQRAQRHSFSIIGWYFSCFTFLRKFNYFLWLKMTDEEAQASWGPQKRNGDKVREFPAAVSVINKDFENLLHWEIPETIWT